jgi:hypothetical protein
MQHFVEEQTVKNPDDSAGRNRVRENHLVSRASATAVDSKSRTRALFLTTRQADDATSILANTRGTSAKVESATFPHPDPE